jgi:hypothetical protein
MWVLGDALCQSDRPLLKELDLEGQYLDASCLDALYDAFIVGSLWSLKRLAISGQGEADGQVRFPDRWWELGPEIRLEQLCLDVPLSDELALRFLEAVADPAFCPCLRAVPWMPGSRLRSNEIKARLEERRRAQAAAAAGWGGAVSAREQELVARSVALEGRVRELEARNGQLEARNGQLEARVQELEAAQQQQQQQQEEEEGQEHGQQKRRRR